MLRIAADGAITLDFARLLGRRGGSLAVQGRIAGGQLTGRADLTALPLAPLSAGLVTGTASGSITASGPTAAPLAEAVLRIEALRATGPALAALPAAQITANALWQGQALRADARLTAGPGIQLTLEASQPSGLGAEAPFAAAVRGQLDLGLLSRPFLDARGDRLTGRAQLNLQASGTPARPLLAGEASLSEGSYINPVLGARLDGIALRLGASGQRLVIQSLTARTPGGGTLAGEGWLEPLGPAIPAEFRLRATAARPITGPYGEAVLDADLRLTGPLANGGSLSGRLDIRRAELRIPDNFAARIPSLGDVREVGPLPPGRRPRSPPRAMPPRPALPMALQLTIAAPRAVFLRGRGAEAELGGEITIAGTLAIPAPQGALRLRRGSINLVGRQLQFSRGLISFDAGTFNPSLDFLASARSRSHTVNLTIKGDPTAPEVTLTSEPELPQDEALARLLFDRETSRLSPFELASIAQALAQLSGVAPRGLGVLERLRTLAGLDRLGVAGDGAGGARVETGRYIAPGVYFGLRQGTSGGAPGVGVQVEITPRLRLEGETSTGPAGDRVGLTWEYEY
jgi:translocation and assembly module TamB